jgi:hypothetical protein
MKKSMKEMKNKLELLAPACIAMPAAMTAVRLSGWRSIAGRPAGIESL